MINNYTNDFDILSMIEKVVEELIGQLDAGQNLELVCGSTTKRFQSLQQAKSVASILLVLSYCHSLYPRTTTTREVYYYFVTHFRSQRECDQAIADCCTLLQVPRHALGLQASSRGWFQGGNLRVYDRALCAINSDTATTAQASSSNPKWDASHEACPITSDWLRFPLQLECTARCILVVEKEGIFQRLVEDQTVSDCCILVTGKGFPDMATRHAVKYMHETLGGIPVLGLADCDPFGVLVLQTYRNEGVPVQWLGLRPSQVDAVAQLTTGGGGLPEAVFQELTSGDQTRLDGLLLETHPFNCNDLRMQELHAMKNTKVELEALHWLGMDFCSNFVAELVNAALADRNEEGFEHFMLPI